jgi:hypothetical protein
VYNGRLAADVQELPGLVLVFAVCPWVLQDAKIRKFFESGSIILIDMTVAYSRMVESISQHYYEITGEKGLIFVDLEVISIQNSQITIKVTDVVTSPNVSPTYQFGSTDYWFWGWAQGKCDGSGQSVGIDAADKLAQYANWS